MSIDDYLARDEFARLTDRQKNVLKRYCRLKHRATQYPLGRCLAYALIRFNCRYSINNQPFSDKFVVWLYTY